MRKTIVIAGGSGYLGQTLASSMQSRGFEVVILTRSPVQTVFCGRLVVWDARTLGPWEEELDGTTAVVNLAGKSVNCRYHARNREEILKSRVDSTRVLGEAIHRCKNPPQVWLNASTATIYKHTFGPAWDESGAIGSTLEAKDAFSVDVATAWEQTLEEAQTPNTRKVAMRMAMVLGRGRNSVFPALRRLTRFGLGGRMGHGRQFVSWIHEIDYCRAVEWLIYHDNVSGPVNMASPNPVPNAEMMKILRRMLGVPFGLPSAAWMLEMGAWLLRTETELIIKSRRVIPAALLTSGFRFQFPAIPEALQNLCN